MVTLKVQKLPMEYGVGNAMQIVATHPTALKKATSRIRD